MPAPELIVLPAAIREAAQARQWYAPRSALAEQAFIAELDHAVREITEAPARWPFYLHGTRRFLMHRFPYMIVYRLKDGTVTVLAIAHSARRPGYWRKR